MNKIRILMTSVGGLVVPNMIKSLRESTINNIYIVGVDCDSDAVGFYFADKSYVVLRGEQRGYSKQLLDIAKREHIDVVLPLSDEELLALAKDKYKFEKEGVRVVCSGYESVRTTLDKGLMLRALKERRLPYPNYRIPRTLTELKGAVEELGYPQKKVVFKPRRGRGARGFWLLNAHLNKREMILKDRDRQEITLEWLLEALGSKDIFPEILVMEYLAGSDFNVDVLACRGEPFYIIPNERLLPKAGPVRVGLVKEDRRVQTVVKQAVKAFNFDYYVNVEVAYRNRTNSDPFIYEINPRISAPIVINKAAGIDLLYLGIKMALGIKPPISYKVKETRMIRYWNELFISGKNRFNSKRNLRKQYYER